MVFVADAAEDSSAPDGGVDRDDRGRVVVRRMLFQTLVWTVAVEVVFVLPEHCAGVVGAETTSALVTGVCPS
jgi:hypothetical protein